MLYYVEWQDEQTNDPDNFPYTTKCFYTIEGAREWRDCMYLGNIRTRIIGHDASTNDWEIIEMG